MRKNQSEWWSAGPARTTIRLSFPAIAVILLLSSSLASPETVRKDDAIQFGGRQVNVSQEQVRSLVVLPWTATRADVVAILGEPAFESQPATLSGMTQDPNEAGIKPHH